MLPFAAFSQQQETPPITVEKISDNLSQLLGGRGANGGFYIGENEVLVHLADLIVGRISFKFGQSLFTFA